MATSIKEVRLSLTVENLEESIRFYQDEMGFKVLQQWCSEKGSGIILKAGGATLELIDKKQAQSTDTLEIGRREKKSVRLAFRVQAPGEQAYKLLKGKATLLAPPINTPEGEVVRLQSPDGLPITLFTCTNIQQVIPVKKQNKLRKNLGKFFELLSLYK